MIPNTLIEMAARPRRNERGSAELRAYARDEWHADVQWILGLFSRPSRRLKIRAWLRRQGTGISSGRSPVAPRRPASRPTVGSSPEDCPHPAVEDLGFGGTASFLRCVLCGGVLILHEGHRWSVNSVEPVAWEEPSDE